MGIFFDFSNATMNIVIIEARVPQMLSALTAYRDRQQAVLAR